jgi:hypothetical protein
VLGLVGLVSTLGSAIVRISIRTVAVPRGVIVPSIVWIIIRTGAVTVVVVTVVVTVVAVTVRWVIVRRSE